MSSFCWCQWHARHRMDSVSFAPNVLHLRINCIEYNNMKCTITNGWKGSSSQRFFFFQMSLTKTKAILSLCYPSIEQRFHFSLKLDGWLLLSFHLDNARRNSMQCQAHSDFTSWKWLLYCFLLRNSGLSSNTLSGKHLRITNYHRFDLEERCFFHCFFF